MNEQKDLRKDGSNRTDVDAFGVRTKPEKGDSAGTGVQTNCAVELSKRSDF